jgi:two-component system, chemotaxis family, chemotaxis protein CheY
VGEVFVVDDEVFIQDLYLNLLTLGGHTVVDTAYNGQEAVEKFHKLKRRPDLIIMDHRMPIKNGVQATTEIRAADPSAKVLFISADASAEDKAHAAGALAFLEKPFSMDSLFRTMKACLEMAAPTARV